MIELPENSQLRPFRVNSTKAIQGKSYRMFNYVACADENAWLLNLDVDQVNRQLQAKRDAFEGLLTSGRFWSLSKKDRERVSPEVRSVAWLDIKSAVEVCLTSKASEVRFVNGFQRTEFNKHGIKERDPMYASMMSILELEKFKSMQSIREKAPGFEAKSTKQAEAEAKSQKWEGKGAQQIASKI